ncbi:hypothetical protein OEA41_009245 [Lepraria neglecta]|uniref:ACB domain-containing protein n=1 Tax=Lepraria neglecta TaxID=209136 RepID=A0AAD9Z1M7_9LECA|nr:hypothetical protein OEA41_009245 [Lepraria neglecta]
MHNADRVFVHALNTVKRIPRTGSARPPPADRLKLYGLYKQSTEGDVEGLSQRPTGSDPDSVAEREKWDAWHAHNSLSRTEAKRRYIATLIETMHNYATTTPEARELVSELEFVWDQIKLNPVSSSASSPGQLARSQGQGVGASYGSINPGQRVGGEEVVSAGLRVLRPVSDGDEEEDEIEEGEEFEEARHAPLDKEEEGIITSQTPDLDVRNRKWRKRIEHSLIKLTTEIAALREQVEAKRIGEGKRRNGVWAWITWLVWVTLRHFVVDLAILGFLVVWARRKGDRRVEQGLELLLGYVRQKAQRIRLPGSRRIPS